MSALSDEKVYRYADSGGVVYLDTYKILRHTPKGFWVEIPYGEKPKFVQNDATKKFAHTTLEKAKESFLARKAMQYKHLMRQVQNVEAAIENMKADRLNQLAPTTLLDFTFTR